MSKCYDCRKTVTKDFKYIDIQSEDGNLIRVAIHDACHVRALKGGPPVEPESAPTNDTESMGGE